MVEIAQRTVAIDRRKAEVYAKGGVPEYWIVDTGRGRLEVRRNPQDGEYGFLQTLGEKDRVRLPEREDQVAVAELLP